MCADVPTEGREVCLVRVFRGRDVVCDVWHVGEGDEISRSELNNLDSVLVRNYHFGMDDTTRKTS